MSRFPPNEEQKVKWVENMGRENWTPSKYAALCSEHFAKNCIDFRDKLPRLRKGSIPTIFGNGGDNRSSLSVIDESGQGNYAKQILFSNNITQLIK